MGVLAFLFALLVSGVAPMDVGGIPLGSSVSTPPAPTAPATTTSTQDVGGIPLG